MIYAGTVSYLESLEGGFICLTAEDGTKYHLVDEAGVLDGLSSGDSVSVEAELIEGFGFAMLEGGMLKVSSVTK